MARLNIYLPCPGADPAPVVTVRGERIEGVRRIEVRGGAGGQQEVLMMVQANLTMPAPSDKPSFLQQLAGWLRREW